MVGLAEKVSSIADRWPHLELLSREESGVQEEVLPMSWSRGETTLRDVADPKQGKQAYSWKQSPSLSDMVDLEHTGYQHQSAKHAQRTRFSFLEKRTFNSLTSLLLGTLVLGLVTGVGLATIGLMIAFLCAVSGIILLFYKAQNRKTPAFSRVCFYTGGFLLLFEIMVLLNQLLRMRSG